MNTETMLAHILPSREEVIKGVLSQVVESSTPPTLYDLEEQTQAVLPRIGQVLLQALVTAQGAGVVGPTRPCPCGADQRYHDQARRLSVQTSVGLIRLEHRAAYRCWRCAATVSPLDEQLGLGQAGRMSRYLQEQSGWLLALLPARMAQQTLVRFGWPAVAASQVREQGEALGAELEQEVQAHLIGARPEAAGDLSCPQPVRQAPHGERLYAAPDGVMYCTTERDPQSGKARGPELKVAAGSAGKPPDGWEQPHDQPAERVEARTPEPVRTRLMRWLREQDPNRPAVAPDQASHVTYVAVTGPGEEFGPRLWAELWARGMGRVVQDVVVVADGSDHIEQVVDSELRLKGDPGNPHLG